jgi:hypothetical protein
MALRSENLFRHAASVEALANGWPEHELLNAVLESGSKCNSEEVQIAAVLSKVHLGKQVDEDFNQLLGLSRILSETLGGDCRNDVGKGRLVPGRTQAPTVAQQSRNRL